MDITPAVPAGRLVVRAYGGGGFRINNARHGGSILLFPDHVIPWPVGGFDELTAADFAPVLSAAPPVELLLIGCGTRHAPLPKDLGAGLRAAGIGCEVMATGPACRTYNVLLGEDRRVAAALIAIR